MSKKGEGLNFKFWVYIYICVYVFGINNQLLYTDVCRGGSRRNSRTSGEKGLELHPKPL